MKGPIDSVIEETQTVYMGAGVRVLCRRFWQRRERLECSVSVLWPGGEWRAESPRYWGTRDSGFFQTVNRALRDLDVDQESDVPSVIAAIKKATGAT